MDDLIPSLIEMAGPVGATAAILLLAFAAIIRWKGWKGFGDGDRMISAARVEQIDTKLGTIDRRLKEVEVDLASRPTREDLYRVELTISRMDERQKGMEATAKATGAAVTRIEDFMLSLSKKGSN
ncbi:hypothetical protein ABWH89_11120 [Hoeflea alexandrii]|jgi:hypothetical protein|uniref:hypothetical protein n=1 Tax=Hoeflea alexandrii TaxID=288436 RepID=UPI0031C56627|nr:hypothetical protein [Hoeflea sp.]